MGLKLGLGELELDLFVFLVMFFLLVDRMEEALLPNLSGLYSSKWEKRVHRIKHPDEPRRPKHIHIHWLGRFAFRLGGCCWLALWCYLMERKLCRLSGLACEGEAGESSDGGVMEGGQEHVFNPEELYITQGDTLQPIAYIENVDLRVSHQGHRGVDIPGVIRQHLQQ